MIRKHKLCVLSALIVVSAGLAARGQEAAAPAPSDKPLAPVPAPAGGPGGSLPPAAAPAAAPQQQPCCCPCDGIDFTVPSFGYWASHTAGSPVRVGEYQDLEPFAFYDLQGLRSDGRGTVDFHVNGNDEEDTHVDTTIYRGGFQANINYDRFIHRYGHENLSEFPYADARNNTAGPPPSPALHSQWLRQDLSMGEDYAYRVQELKTSFKGRLSDSLRVRLDVWGLEKEGDRDARSMQECYNHVYSTANPSGPPPAAQPSVTGFSTNHCHVLSQAQHIDWQTVEVKPIVEWNLGPIVLEYSRPMRAFSQNDQTVYRFYDENATVANPGEFGPARFMEYGVVPDSFTQMDQLKISAELNEDNRFYAFLFTGNTRKESDIAPPVAPQGATYTFLNPPEDERVSNRRYNGADLRWTNTTIPNVTITPYGRIVEEDNQPAAFLIPGDETRPGVVGNNGVPIEDDPTGITPINYRREQLGTRVLWRPFGGGFGLGGLAINGSYEYGILHRTGLTVDSADDLPPFTPVIVEENTLTNIFTIGPSVRWSSSLDTYLRYKYYDTEHPLFATNFHETNTRDSFAYTAYAQNTALPQHDNIVEFGGTWYPNTRFLLNAWVAIDIQQQDLGLTSVTLNPGTPQQTIRNVSMSSETQNFPFGINGSYRVNEQFSLNGGFAYYTNWIDQDVAFGAGEDHGFGTAAPNNYGVLTNRWSYGGRAMVFNLGAAYCLTSRLRLVGSGEYVHGLETAYQLTGDPNFPSTSAALSDIPSLFRQDVITTRVTAGIDYRIAPRITTYFRYVLYDYNDRADNARVANAIAAGQPLTGLPLSGTSNFFLTGLSAIF